MEAAWTVHVVPLGHVTPLGVEYLNPVILPVGHIHISLFIGANTVNEVELPGVGARLPPGEQVPPIRRKFMDPGIPIAIGHI
jgi:hypothetical protein